MMRKRPFLILLTAVLATAPLRSAAQDTTATSAMFRVEAGKLEHTPASDLRNRLTGILPGVEVTEKAGYGIMTSSLGSLGMSNSFYGVASRGKSPVCIVDGVPIPFEHLLLDPEQIVSVTRICDIADKHLVSPAAGGGALYIRTRRGEFNTPMRVTVSAEGGAGFVDRVPEWVGGLDYMDLNNRAREADGYTLRFSDELLEGYAGSTGAGDMTYPLVNYRELMQRSYQPLGRVAVSASGGSGNVRYALALTGLHQGDLIIAGPTADMNRVNLSTSVSARIGRYVEASASFHGLLNIRRRARGSFYEFRAVPEVAYPLTLSVDHDSEIYDPELMLGNTAYGVSRLFPDNPYAMAVEGGSHTHKHRSGLFNFQLDADLSPLLKGLRSRTRFAFSNFYYTDNSKTNDYLAYFWRDGDIEEISAHKGVKASGKKVAESFTYQSILAEERLDWNRSFGVHDLHAAGSMTIGKASHADYGQEARQFYGLIEADYTLLGRYALTALVTPAASGLYPKNNRTAFFPAFGASWKIAQEPFLRGWTFLDECTLRTQWGKVAGGDLFGSAYLYNANYTLSAGMTFGPATLSPWFGSEHYTANMTTITRLANPDLTWPTLTQWDIALDLRLFNSLSLTAACYRIAEEGLITNVSSARSTVFGWNGVNWYENYNAQNTRGLEVTARWDGRIGNVNLGIGGWIASYETVYARYSGDLYEYPWQKIEGTATDTYRGLTCIGRFQSEEEIASSALLESNTRVGDLKYLDRNEDGTIDDNDRGPIGHTNPRLRAGVSLDFRWKGLDLNVVGTGRARFQTPLTNEWFWNGWGDGNYSAFVLNNIGGDYPRLGYDKSATNFTASDFWLREGGWFKIQSAEIGYTFRFAEGKPLQHIRCCVRGGNLLTFSKIKDIDPEAPDSGVSAYPLMRTVTGCIQVAF